MRILVVDDDDLARGRLRVLLRGAGHQVVEATDGEAAWELHDAGPFRIIVSDWMMPRLSGVDLCRRVRRRPQTGYTYFILVSGVMVGDEALRAAMEVGVDDLLPKPVERAMVDMRLRVAERIIALSAEVARLEGLIPVCACCKRVRGRDGDYVGLEAYIEENSLASFTHGVCPECMARLTESPGRAAP
ncbi:MAG: response regulator [Elusimicrobia bacterium]|nr:response regulator [Elusimicrobiota bacterium]